MALLYMDGFDAGDYALRWICSNTSQVSNVSTTRFGSGLAVQTNSSTVLRPIPASSKVFVGAAIAFSLLDSTARPYLSLYGDNATVQHLSIGLRGGAIDLRRPTPQRGTLLATAPFSFTANAYNYIEVMATIADTGGRCVVRLNGVVVIDFTGDTRNGGTSANVDALLLGANGGTNCWFDDVYICDDQGAAPYNDFLGDVRVRTLSPTADGSSKQFTPDSGTTNYSRVNEVPYSTANYVRGSSGQRDTYAMADLPASPGQVLAVQNNAIAKKTDAGALSIKNAVKSGADVYYGGSTPLGVSDAVVSTLRTTDPATSAAWTVAGVNALEAGVEVA
jgi:hypothetical protein